MSTMEGMRNGVAIGHDDAAQQMEHTPDLLRLFSLDLVHCPRLEREEEYALTCRTRSAWSRLLASLQEQQALITALAEEKKTLTLPDHLSEPEVLRLLQRVETYVNRAEKQDNSSYNAPLRAWLEKVRGALSYFRVCRDEIVRRNLRLVVKLARRYQGRGLELLDLVQEGVLGMMRAVEKFDPERRVAFSSYAVWWIRQALIRALTQRGAIAFSFHHQPPPQLLTQGAQDTDGDKRAVGTQWIPLAVRLVSLDTPLRGDAECSLAEFVASPEASSPEEAILNADETRGLHRELALLPSQEADILRLRFGFVDDYAYTYDEIGRRLGISREQARLREQRALARLKKQFQHEAVGDRRQRTTFQKRLAEVSV